jgi:hypothetical protein
MQRWAWLQRLMTRIGTWVYNLPPSAEKSRRRGCAETGC